MRGYRLRLRPSKTIQQKLNEQMELCRGLYNRLLEELNNARKEGRRITQRDTQALIVELKTEKPELKKIHSKVLQMVNHQLWSNMEGLSRLKQNGKKIGKPRFKGVGWFKTLNYNQSGFKIEEKKLILSKVGEIPIKIHRPIKGRIKGVVIKREKSGKWFANLQVENAPQPLPSTMKAVGIDMGVKHFLTDSEGRQVENPRFYEKTLERIRILQRKLSKKRKGSENREKARIRLAEAYERLVNQRDDFLHKLSRFYANNYTIIFVENLRVQNLVRKRNLAQKILDASWGKFFQLLSYKAESAGGMVVRKDPWGTTQDCSNCGRKVPKTLGERMHRCPYCGIELDRDYNASLNILYSGLGRPAEPAETRPLQVIPASLIIEAGSLLR
nr:transposase [Candidatus Freyarchaeota archaeon]